MPLPRRTLVLAALVLTVPTAASAQRYLALAGNATYLTLPSSAFTYSGTGVGGEAQIRAGSGLFSIGVGGLTARVPAEQRAGNYDVRGIFIEPRVTLESFDPDGDLRPYAFGRAMWGVQEGRISDDPVAVDYRSVAADVRMYGAGAGIMLRLSSLVSLDLAGSYSAASLTDIDDAGTTLEDERGGSVGARVGFQIRFGGDDLVGLRR